MSYWKLSLEKKERKMQFHPTSLGAVHKLCRLRGGGGVKNCQFYLVKRRLKGGGGQKPSI